MKEISWIFKNLQFDKYGNEMIPNESQANVNVIFKRKHCFHIRYDEVSEKKYYLIGL